MPSSPRPSNPTWTTPDHLSGGGSSTPRYVPGTRTINNRGAGYEEILAKARAGAGTNRSTGSDYLGDSVRQFQNTPGMTQTFLNWDDRRRAAAAGANPNPTPPGGGYPTGGGGGGGGSAGPDMDAVFGGYYKKVMEALAGMKAPTDTLTPKIGAAVDADIAFANDTYGGVGKADFDPYKDFTPVASQFDPGTAAMMEAQGMGGEAALAQQMGAQQELQTMADLWANYGKAQSADQQAANARFNSGVESDRAGAVTELGAQKSALLAAAQAQAERDAREHEREKMQAILQLLSSGFGAGVDVSGYDLGGLI